MSAARSRFVLLVSMLGCLAAFAVAMLMGPPTEAQQQAPRGTPAGAPAPHAAALGAELETLRTARSRTYAGANGLRRTRIWASPVNFRDARGTWQRIDTRLRRDGSGYVTAAAGTVTSLPEVASQPARVNAGDAWLSFALRGASEAVAAVRGANAVYADALPGVDVRYDVQATGVKETLTLADAQAPSTYSYDLRSSDGLSPSLQDDGSIAIRDREGRTRFVLPAPTVQAADDAAPHRKPVAYRLADGGRRLTVVVDAAWLKAAKFPVEVDPSVWRGGTVGCTLASGTPSTSSCNGSQLKVGRVGGGTPSTLRTVLRFADLGAIDQTASIADAQLFVPIATAGSANARIDAYALTRTPTTAATWNTYDGTNAWTTPGGDVGSSPEDYLTLNAGQTGLAIWDVSRLAERWVRDSSTNKGILLRANDETVANTIVFGGLTAADTPALEIDWAAHPGTERDGTYESMGIDDRSGLSVNVATGNLVVQSEDIKLPGVAGNGLSIQRTFNSTVMTNTSTGIDDSIQQPYGKGWTWTVNGAGLYQVYVFPSSTRVITGAGGALYRFDRDRSKDDASNLGYTTPPGIDADLKVSKTDSTSTLTFRKSGLKWKYAAHDSSNRARLSSIVDRHGNATSISYRSDRKVDQITDTYGRALTFNYDAGGKLQTVTGGGGRTWTYNLTTAGTATVLGSFSNPDGKTTTYSYDAASSTATAKLNKITDARSHDLLFQYGTGLDGGRVTQITRVVDGTTTNDVVTKFDYRPASGVGHACAASGVVGRTVETDPENHATTHCVNNKGQVVETWDAKNRKTTTEYTAGSNVATFTGLAGTANPSLTTFTWDNSSGNFQGSKTDVGARSQQTTVNYCTDSGQPACGSGSNAQYVPTKHTDSQGTATTYGYNATGDLTDVQTGSATGDHQQLDYDGVGNVKWAKDGLGHQTTFNYDTNHFLTSVAPPSPLAPRTYTPDAINRIATTSSGNGSTATLTYDGEDRVKQIAFDNGGATFDFTYDANGNVTQRTDSLGNTTTYTYDNLNRRKTEYVSSGGNTNTYTYDKAGNLKSIQDTDGTTTYGYDEINRVSSITSPKPGGSTNAITFDYLDPSATGDPSTVTANFPGGLKQRTTSDSAGNVLSVKVLNSSGTVLKKRDYSHDRTSSATSAQVQTMADESGNVTSYSYSGPGRLTGATTVNGSTPVEQWTYDFDAAGNRTKRTHTVGTGTPNVTSYFYNAANQMCWSVAGTPSSPACSPAPSGATTYTYGNSGDRTTGMSYDAGNRLWKIGTTDVYNLAPIHNGETIGYGTTGSRTTCSASRGSSRRRAPRRISSGRRSARRSRSGSGRRASRRSSPTPWARRSPSPTTGPAP